jgi:MTH538 TIR-like domain (DUF1863)
MAGRRVFFSFHYKDDVWRASNARNAGQFDARAAAGWSDASLWEETKKKGPAAIRCLIDGGLEGTSVTAVLIGTHTAERNWVTYEIEKSIERGNGLLGVRIHNMKDQDGRRSGRGRAARWRVAEKRVGMNSAACLCPQALSSLLRRLHRQRGSVRRRLRAESTAVYVSP